MTTKRYYYTDPLAAAWMAKHHDMIYDFADAPFDPHPWNMPGQYVETHANKELVMRYGVEKEIVTPELRWANHKYYVYEDSLHMLDGQDADRGIDARGLLVFMEYGNWEYVDSTQSRSPAEPVKIILRNGKAFMWPEVEDIVA